MVSFTWKIRYILLCQYIKLNDPTSQVAPFKVIRLWSSFHTWNFVKVQIHFRHLQLLVKLFESNNAVKCSVTEADTVKKKKFLSNLIGDSIHPKFSRERGQLSIRPDPSRSSRFQLVPLTDSLRQPIVRYRRALTLLQLSKELAWPKYTLIKKNFNAQVPRGKISSL